MLPDAFTAPAETSSRAPPSDALFRAAADQAPQVIWIVNAKGAVTYLNHAWYELVGGTPPKWYGHEWGDVVHPEDLEQMRERWKTVGGSGEMFEGTRRVRAVDGTWHTLSYRATPVFDAQGLACWVGMDSDITEMVAAQSALQVANHELEAFSYAVSHDLRTPLVTVQGFSGRIAKALEGAGNEKVRHYLDRLTQAVAHMELLIGGLLALSDAKRQRLALQQVDLSKLATDILEMLAQQDPQRRFTAGVAPGLVAHADGRLMFALLENLLGNAWKFTSATAHAQIEVGLASTSSAQTCFFVRDNGAGFDMARSASLFNAFERLHSATEFPGMGIGLATVNRIVARHGGRAWAESEPGKGSTFYFALPNATSSSATR